MIELMCIMLAIVLGGLGLAILVDGPVCLICGDNDYECACDD